MSVDPASEFSSWSRTRTARVEEALVRALAVATREAPEALGAAMRHAVLGGGKRLRPLLALAACEAVRGDEALALRAAVAVELVHAYSLVHDDMPCMDDDVLRRGQPTVHVKFGEAVALLVGDALQALAFEVLTSPFDAEAGAPGALATEARLCSLLARAAGATGMAGGQAIDLESVGLSLSIEQLREMHRRKTGALLKASVLMGAASVSIRLDAVQARALDRYGAAVGLAFQVVDDILDVTTDTASLGKTAGKDEAANKPTYVSLLGIDDARAQAHALHAEALAALATLTDTGHDARALASLADLVVRRTH